MKLPVELSLNKYKKLARVSVDGDRGKFIRSPNWVTNGRWCLRRDVIHKQHTALAKIKSSLPACDRWVGETNIADSIENSIRSFTRELSRGVDDGSVVEFELTDIVITNRHKYPFFFHCIFEPLDTMVSEVVTIPADQVQIWQLESIFAVPNDRHSPCYWSRNGHPEDAPLFMMRTTAGADEFRRYKDDVKKAQGIEVGEQPKIICRPRPKRKITLRR